ncbi:unnamed protein product [Rotaria sordida]|uniref:G-protein coupled receptors family 1 profile domain-containing protein n=1 Tax=Rotaria sordida TaxID=392033 RepID=A0A815F5C4_9BILA|nr:unnamed protein product [Rotaria sordida]CAF3823222.1 unnamed protein product [Rotaria sordida]
MPNNNISSTTNIGYPYSVDLIPPIVKFWLYLVFLIPSIICAIFVLYHLLCNQTFRRSLNNHVIIVLLLTVVVCQVTVFPWMLYYEYHINTWSRSFVFCLIWGFIDWGVYLLQLLLFAWASIERHILIFHDKWVSTKKKRFFVHYLPLIIIILYWFIFYTFVYFYPPCKNIFENSQMICVKICLFQSFVFRALEMLFHYIIPCFTIIFLGIILILRVLWQKHRMHQPIRWRRHRKMTVQLLSISVLYLLVTAPWAIMIFLRICGLPYDVGEGFENLTFFISYYIVLFFPFVSVLSLPELRTKFKNVLHLPRVRRIVGPETFDLASIKNQQVPM